MRQLPDSMELSLVEQRLRREILDITDRLDERVQTLELPVFETSDYGSSPNYLPNSHPEWSLMAFTTAGTTPATAGDANHEAYASGAGAARTWKYQTAATTDLSTVGAALIGSGHSGFGALNADAPIWDRTNATFLLGSSGTNYDVACLLPTDFVFPGQVYYVYFEASLAAADTDINDTQFYCGFWDDTVGQEKWIEGSDFTPTISVYGATGARTLSYKIHALTDSGTEMLSTEVTVANAPATLTAENHVRLNFSGQPGFIQYIIYREDGANYYRVGDIRNSIDLQFFDIQETGSSVVPVSGYPVVTGARPKAYSQTSTFDPGPTGSFVAHTMSIQVPIAYNRSNTGNLQQWFRFGLTGLVGGVGSRREVVIRKISVSQGYGGWTRSPLDLAALSGPSGAATSAPTGGTPTTLPPDGGTGGPVCLVPETIVKTLKGDKPMGEIKKGDMLICGATALQVKRIKRGSVQFVWEIELESGQIVRCSDSHKWVRSLTDRNGRPTHLLKIGDSLLTEDFIESKIVRKEMIVGQQEVIQVFLPPPHLFIANGIVSHNTKPIDVLPY
jgi:hypothetical protein